MNRYFLASYTDGPCTRWQVIDRASQEIVSQFAYHKEAQDHADKMNDLMHGWRKDDR